MALLLTRPILLLVAALIGGVVGFAATGNGGYQATATLEFTTSGNDSLAVKQTGQTLARTATTGNVLSAAQASVGPDADGLAQRVTAQWEQDTQLVTVTVVADTPEAAIAQANAVAGTVVATVQGSIADRLAAARDESNQVLTAQALTSADAEAARQAQLGIALAARQDDIIADSSAQFVSDQATEASAAGLTRVMGVAIGLIAGLLLGGLVSLLLGVRGLRVRSPRAMRQFVPGTEVTSASESAQLAGRFVESGKSCLAVVVAPGSEQQGTAFAHDVVGFVRAHGRAVVEIGPAELKDRQSVLALLRRDARNDIRGQFGADALTVTVTANSEAAALLEGQSDIMAVVVVRRQSTTVRAALNALSSFSRANPTLVLAN